MQLQIVDLPPDPNLFQVGTSYYARYWDRDPSDITSSLLALTVERTPPSLDDIPEVGDLQASHLLLENTSE